LPVLRLTHSTLQSDRNLSHLDHSRDLSPATGLALSFSRQFGKLIRKFLYFIALTLPSGWVDLQFAINVSIVVRRGRILKIHHIILLR